jgi:hypothetical protein
MPQEAKNPREMQNGHKSLLETDFVFPVPEYCQGRNAGFPDPALDIA